MKKMRNIFKLLAVFVIAFVAFNSVSIMVSADAAKSIKLGSPEDIPAYVASTHFTTKTTADGKYVYCLNIHKSTAKNITANLVGERDAGVAYLMANGYPNKSFTGDRLKDYYITQTALWWYLDDTTGTSNLSVAFKTNGSDSHGLRPHIKKLVNGAKQAKNKGYAKPSIKLSVSNNAMTLSNGYYISEAISATASNIGSYKVAVSEGPVGTVIVDEAGNSKSKFSPTEKFRVKVPVSKVTSTSLKIKVSAVGSGTVNKAYEYQPTDQGMQNVVPVILTPITTEVSAAINLSISTSKVTVIKIDKATGNTLAGAKLVLKDASGKNITSWTSTVNGHVIQNLSDGTYTVTEVDAPKGYKLNSKPVSFTISKDKRNVTVKLYNEVKKATVNINKVDAETGNTLAGAVLLVKDAGGNVVARFTTTNEPYVLTDLEDGTYTVSEESAPSGYIASTDVISFTIDDEHTSHQITFKNYKEVFVPNTASGGSIIFILLGLGIIGAGAMFVYKNAKHAK